MKRVAVIGNSGAGKSTLAAALSVKAGLPLIASDPFYWERDWQAAPAHLVRQRITEAAAADAWVLDGNFVSERGEVWARADTIIWLDYPLPLVLWRVLRRNLGWFFTRRITWSGNRMTWRSAWSGIRHAHRGFAEKRATFPAYLQEFPHLTVLHFHSPHQVNSWLSGVDQTKGRVL